MSSFILIASIVRKPLHKGVGAGGTGRCLTFRKLKEMEGRKMGENLLKFFLEIPHDGS